MPNRRLYFVTLTSICRIDVFNGSWLSFVGELIKHPNPKPAQIVIKGKKIILSPGICINSP